MLPDFRVLATGIIASAACVWAVDADQGTLQQFGASQPPPRLDQGSFQQCGTSQPPLRLVDLVPEAMNQGANITKRDGQRYVVPTYITVLAKDNTVAGGSISESQIKEQINWVNKHYEAAHIFFDASVRRVWYDIVPEIFSSGTFTADKKETIIKYFPERNDASLNIVFAFRWNDMAGDGSGNVGQWWQYKDTRTYSDGREEVTRTEAVFISSAAIPGVSGPAKKQTNVLIHEIGHWLGLAHTDGDNCSSDNDGIKDTPPHLTKALYGLKACEEVGALRTCGFADPIKNFMNSFSIVGCDGHEFTDGQRKRMRDMYAARLSTQPNNNVPHEQQQPQNPQQPEPEQNLQQPEPEQNPQQPHQLEMDRAWQELMQKQTNDVEAEFTQVEQQVDQANWGSSSQVRQGIKQQVFTCFETALRENAERIRRFRNWRNGRAGEDAEEDRYWKSINVAFQQKRDECRTLGQQTAASNRGNGVDDCLGRAQQRYDQQVTEINNWAKGRSQELQAQKADITQWQKMNRELYGYHQSNSQWYEQQKQECKNRR